MTGFTSNIDELILKFKALNDRPIDPIPALIAGVNAAKAQMQQRIFNQSLDALGQSLGKYIGKKNRHAKKPSRALTKAEEKAKAFLFGEQSDFTEYELIRLRAGRQVIHKDLEFTGDLRRGIQVTKDGETKVICWIPNDQLFLIAQGQEEQIGRIRGQGKAEIFSLSKEENETLSTTTTEILKQIYDGAINS